jgi:hypothetical protein
MLMDCFGEIEREGTCPVSSNLDIPDAYVIEGRPLPNAFSPCAFEEAPCVARNASAASDTIIRSS